MREILFRGKRVDNGEWETGCYVRLYGSNGKVSRRIYTGCAEVDCGDYYPDWFDVIPSTVGQYTGLTDKNGKRIFEGDIVKDGCDLMVVVWQEYAARFALKFSADGDYSQSIPRSNVYLEVIGNIHDNPEMIGGTEDGK